MGIIVSRVTTDCAAKEASSPALGSATVDSCTAVANLAQAVEAVISPRGAGTTTQAEEDSDACTGVVAPAAEPSAAAAVITMAAATYASSLMAAVNSTSPEVRGAY